VAAFWYVFSAYHLVYSLHMSDHPVYASTLTHYLALLTILGAVFLALFAVTLAYLSYTNKMEKYAKCLGNYIFPIGFFVSFGGIFITLFYSQVLGYAPCDLCWYQRVFLYPQACMFAYAWYKKDRAVLPYVLILSIVGFGLALYHHALQIGYDLLKPCSTAPFAVDCAKPSFIEFGFVTFPFMAVVLFGFLVMIITTALHRRDERI
jgi:disulfide bond formation protein DsbB